MSSVSSKTVRRKPQQQRSERTLAALLEAAAALILENGVDGFTMTDLAARGEVSIGGLYHYFPDKKAVVVALISLYGRELEQQWKPLIGQEPGLSPARLASFLLEIVVQFLRERPAFLALVGSPIRFRGNSSVRKALRVAVAEALRAQRPELPEKDAMLDAHVIVQLMRGLMHMLTETAAAEQPRVIEIYRDLLTHFLGRVLRAS